MRLKKPVEPGQVLKQKLEEANIAFNEFAKYIGVPVGSFQNRLSCKAPLDKKRNINYTYKIRPNMALKLADTLKTTPQYWLDLQMNYDLWEATKNHKKLKPFPVKKS